MAPGSNPMHTGNTWVPSLVNASGRRLPVMINTDLCSMFPTSYTDSTSTSYITDINRQLADSDRQAGRQAGRQKLTQKRTE